MQKMMKPSSQIIKAIYFLTAIAFHLVLLLTDVGNYFHGGTWVELVALQTAAVLITVTAIKLLPRVRMVEKIFVLLCAVVPFITIAWSLISALT